MRRRCVTAALGPPPCCAHCLALDMKERHSALGNSLAAYAQPCVSGGSGATSATSAGRSGSGAPAPELWPRIWVLEAAGFETWLVNAMDVKHRRRPGAPGTPGACK